MKKITTRFFPLLMLLSLLSLFAPSCQKELSGDQVTPPVVVPDVPVKASVEGIVTDENGDPVDGATVKSGAAATSTDVNGYFNFKNITLSSNAGFITVTSPGYFTGSRTIVVKEDRNHFVRIELIPQTLAGIVNAVTGGTVSVAGGATITLPANGIVNKATNAPYTGQVTVAAAWLDPTAGNLSSIMPGDLRGIGTNGGENGLKSYGMVAVELTGGSGEALQIAPNASAKLVFPIPAALQGAAPATIPLWFFDEVKGLWKEEGSATKSGNTYIGNVSHFSFWNCDAPFPLITFSATFLTSGGQALSNSRVEISSNSNNIGTGYGYTNSEGFLTGKIPANQSLTLIIRDYCGSVVYSQNIGPFSNTADLGNIIVGASGNIMTITGTVVNCSNAPVTNGYVYIVQNGVNTPTAINNGSFSITLPKCQGTNSVDLFAVDVAALVQSTTNTLNVTSGNNNAGQLQACGISAQEFIQYSLDNVPYAFTAPVDTLTAYFQQTNTNITGADLPFNTYISFSFSNPTAAPGNYPLNNLQVWQLDSTIIVSPITVNITNYGVPSLFIEGNFSGVVRKGSTATNVNMTCNFRVRRSF
jgi:hypothetical protein